MISQMYGLNTFQLYYSNQGSTKIKSDAYAIAGVKYKLIRPKGPFTPSVSINTATTL